MGHVELAMLGQMRRIDLSRRRHSLQQAILQPRGCSMLKLDDSSSMLAAARLSYGRLWLGPALSHWDPGHGHRTNARLRFTGAAGHIRIRCVNGTDAGLESPCTR